MADGDDDVNSSDIEYDAPKNPFFDVGKASIQAMIENAVSDRFESKKRAKQLSYTKGSKKTQAINALWYNRFQAFRESTLRVNTQATPTGEQIERFISVIVQRVKPRTNTVPAYSWMGQGVGRLCQTLVFYFKSFTLSKHEAERISTTIDTLWHEGKLTKESSWERNWVGAFLVRKLAGGLIKDALVEGTLNWDVTLAKVLSILLVASFGARSGDVTVAPLDTQELPYLCYRDINLKLVGGDKLENFVAKCTIRNEKGFKGDGRKNRSVTLSCLKNADDNVVCPIKFLLIMALRLGKVAATTIDDLLVNASLRNDKKVIWVDGSSPVLCAFSSGAAFLEPNKAAGNHQLTGTMKAAGLIAGLLTTIRSHDLRRGAVRDNANRKSAIIGAATEAVAATVGHTKKSHSSGLTDLYAGSLAEDGWSKRLEEDFDGSFSIDVADAGYRKRRKLNPGEIEERCRIDGLDSSKRNDRVTASRRIYRQDANVWTTQQRGRARSPAGDTTKSALSEKTASEINAEVLPRTYASIDAAPKPPYIQDFDLESATPTDLSSLEDTILVDHIPIDPRLLNTGEDIIQTLVGSKSIEMTEEMEDDVFARMEVLQTAIDGLDPVLSEPIEFVRHFSRINITRSQTIAQHGLDSQRVYDQIVTYQGNSRDELSLFPYACNNADFGCLYEHPFWFQVEIHERTCKYTSIEAANKLHEKKKFACESCEYSSDLVGQLNQHVKLVHNWEPRACKSQGCDPNLVYQTKSALELHMKTHAAYKPSRCLFPGCTNPQVYALSQNYRRHLGVAHNVMERSEKDKHMPGYKAPYVAQKCRVEGCESKQIFAAPGKIKQHLREKHGYSDEDVNAYLA